MDASKLRRMKEMETENSRLKRMYADLDVQNELLKEALGKKFRGQRGGNVPVSWNRKSSPIRPL